MPQVGIDLRGWVARYPLRTAVVFQAALIPLALVLGRLLEIPLLEQFQWRLHVPLIAVLATVPMLLLLALLAVSGLLAYRRLEVQVRELLGRLFRGAPPGSVVLLALLAGTGEEMLVRGVLQGWLAGQLPVAWAILLAALAFGLAHYISGLYFVFATLIGIYLGLVYHVTDNLLVVGLAHALYDWIVIRLYLRTGRRPQQFGTERPRS